MKGNKAVRWGVWALSVITLCVPIAIVAYILIKGIPHLTPQLFAWSYNSDNVSLMPALINTLEMTALALMVAVPLGVGAAIYLVEYSKRGSRLVAVMRMATETLSGIPSIIYGLFGSLFFVGALHLKLSLISGALTLSLMILPVIIRASEEALIAVPDSFREGSFGLGAGRLRTIWRLVLPSAMPGVIGGVILGAGRIVGETAALIYTAGTVAKAATALTDSARTLSVHMYTLSGEGLYIDQTYATAVVLILLVLAINAISELLGRKMSARGRT